MKLISICPGTHMQHLWLSITDITHTAIQIFTICTQRAFTLSMNISKKSSIDQPQRQTSSTYPYPQRSMMDIEIVSPPPKTHAGNTCPACKYRKYCAKATIWEFPSRTFNGNGIHRRQALFSSWTSHARHPWNPDILTMAVQFFFTSLSSRLVISKWWLHLHTILLILPELSRRPRPL